jgi:hypothetical protein
VAFRPPIFCREFPRLRAVFIPSLVGVGGNKMFFVPVWQAKEVFLQPDIHRTFDEAACHGQ